VSTFVKKLLKAGIVGVVGANGGGKDLLIARLAHESLAQGRPLLSNLGIYQDGQPHPGATPLTSLKQLLTWDGDIWLSEITTVAGSRESSNLPVQVQAKFQQLRKGEGGCRLWWSAPSFQRADTVLREVSQVIVKTRGTLPERAVEGHIWAPRRLFLMKAYDARELVDFNIASTAATAQKHRRLRAMDRDRYWRPGKPHQDLYRTLEAVSVVGFGVLTGTCLDCEGRRSQHACTCPDQARARRPRRIDVKAAADTPPDLQLVEAPASYVPS
jgi:hypothetical protein